VVEPAMAGEYRETVYDKIQLPAVIQGYRIPANSDPEYYAVSMLNTLLTDGSSSRLQKSLVDRQQLAVGLGAFPFPSEDPGIAVVFCVANMGKTCEELEKAIDAELDLIRANGVGEAEFAKLRNQVESSFISGKSGMTNIAEELANYEVYLGDANLINTELERYLKVTPADLQNAAKKYYVKENRVNLYYLPKP
jgi:zinc protease